MFEGKAMNLGVREAMKKKVLNICLGDNLIKLFSLLAKGPNKLDRLTLLSFPA
jgi:hypothetical protein